MRRAQLGGANKFFVLKVLRLKQSQQGVAEQKWVHAIVESEAHFVQVGL